MREKSRLILLSSIQDIITNWVIGKILDYFLKRLSKRVKLEGEAHLGDYLNYCLWKFLDRMYLRVYFRYLLNYNTAENTKIASQSPYFPKTARMVLETHKNMHKNMDEIKACRYCKALRENRNFFQIFVTNPELYPPFEFSRSS